MIVHGFSLPEDVQTIWKLRKALEFYADPSNWIDGPFGENSSVSHADWDGGELAAEALSEQANLIPHKKWRKQ